MPISTESFTAQGLSAKSCEETDEFHWIPPLAPERRLGEGTHRLT